MIYFKKNLELDISDKFIYLEEIFLIYPNRWELFKSQTYKSEVPLNRKNSLAYSENYGCNIQRYWELIAAPEQFLINNGFKPKL